jgi:hypothetical protein
MSQQIEGFSIGPVEVVEEEADRSNLGEGRDKAGNRPEQAALDFRIV